MSLRQSCPVSLLAWTPDHCAYEVDHPLHDRGEEEEFNEKKPSSWFMKRETF